MTKLIWDQVGERRYETGADRGVLFVNDKGYPWSGLLAVNEGHTGGDNKAYYIDGVRYANHLTLEEFEATIEAFTYPDAFTACDGTKVLAKGLFVTQQRRKSFGFSYRTLIGNDVEGLEHGYKIHLVYNALAEPFDRPYKSVSDAPSPMSFSWKITTKPPVLDFIPTAHYIIDSRVTPAGLLSLVEDILYGNLVQEPRLPTAGELAYLFSSFENPEFDGGAPDAIYYYTFDGGLPEQGIINTTIDGGTP